MKNLFLSFSLCLLSILIQAQNPIAYYPFTGNADDAAGSNHGTVNGATLTTDRFGNANSAYSFDGVDDQITAPLATTAVHSVSMSGWVKLHSTASNQMLFYNGNSSQNGWGLYVSSGGNLKVLHGGIALYTTTANLVTNTWYHLALVELLGGNSQVYVNGQLVYNGSTSAVFTPSATMFMSSNTISTEYLNGSLDEVKVYNMALSASQILTEYGNSQSGLVAYYPFNGNANDAVGTNHGTANGATLTTDRFGNANSAYSFDGVDDFIGIGSLDFATNDYSISYWVNVNATATDIAVVSGNDPAALNQTFMLSGFSGGVGRFLHRNPSGATGGVNLAGIQTLTLGQWKFVTCIKQGTTLTYYVNGVVDNTITDVAATNISSAIYLEFGRLMSSAFTPIYHLNGKIDEIKIYNTALSPAQVLAEYSNANQMMLPIAILNGGSNGTCNSANTNNMNGGNASGVGCGGGGAGYWGGHGGNGYFGGGGGGAAGLNAPNRIGGNGGSGAIAMALANSSGSILLNALLVSGSSFTFPAGVAQVKVFTIGAGGGGAGATNTDGTSGGGGAAGGIAFKKFTVAPGDIMTYNIGVGGAGGMDANNGSAGTNTQATLNGITIMGNGGNGGLFNNNTDAVGGSFSGGDGGVMGGNGKGTSGDNGGGGGGGIGGGFNASVTCAGGIGANSQDIDILFGILQNTVNNIDNLPTLIAHYPLNGDAVDSSGNNLHGTIIGTISNVVDRNGNANSAIAFNGNVANRIEVDDNILLHTPSITISAWVKLNSLGSIKTMVDKPLGGNVSDSWHFGTENNNFHLGILITQLPVHTHK
ncbi:MAG: LamG domain-containing protein [Bacteroidetes bacterium]|nr:LamG domain-containing protein [Bacteroidota bacterium]